MASTKFTVLRALVSAASVTGLLACGQLPLANDDSTAGRKAATPSAVLAVGGQPAALGIGAVAADIAKCAHNPPEWYGFVDRPDCFRNYPLGSRAWDFVDDFRLTGQQNPSADSYGNSNVWSYRSAPGNWTPGDWANAPLLNAFGVTLNPDVTGWMEQPDLYPFIGVWPSLHFGTAHPNNVDRAHPKAVADWHAPGGGTFWVNLYVFHADNGGGDGVRWSLYSRGTSGAAQLIGTGIVDTQNQVATRRLDRIDFQTGGDIFLVIDPIGDLNFDTTNFRLTVFGVLQ